jgi:hypothetical protein
MKLQPSASDQRKFVCLPDILMILMERIENGESCNVDNSKPGAPLKQILDAHTGAHLCNKLTVHIRKLILEFDIHNVNYNST